MAGKLIESSRFSLDEFCFHSNSIKFSEAKSGKSRDVLDAFRTVYWFHSLRIGLRAHTTYQLEKTLEPDAFCVDANGGSYRRNKWGAYRWGKHTPSQKLITGVNNQFEGSQDEFEHVLWKTLRLSQPAVQNAEMWIRQLAPDIQSILWNKSKKASGGRTRVRQVGSRHLQMIERRASLDSLACLTILLRAAHETGQSQEAFKIAKSLCRVLLMVGDILNGHGISRPLYEYYEDFILPLGSWQEKHFSYRGISFMELVGGLCHRLYHLKNIDICRLSEPEKMLLKLKIIDGNYGLDYMLLLNPIAIPTKPFSDHEHTESLAQNVVEKRRQSALKFIIAGGDGRFVLAGT